MSVKIFRRSENGSPWTTLVCGAAQEEEKEKYLMFHEVAYLHGSDSG
jgi:hypothetical protein